MKSLKPSKTSKILKNINILFFAGISGHFSKNQIKHHQKNKPLKVAIVICSNGWQGLKLEINSFL